ncbi:ubiquitin carboxyl-terminal hydrolase 4 [Lentinula aff. lateritia]|uniref:Ubiquitin carboxyl-terminal hydrolase 4 n=1 Tax=Lentinula aff. lateritia TaxID=2804960 RepID=A0ACC1TPD6_9AGAR|nr:ubiquitin carboxyl-terminal hydrolase 4 [Lentinula aff. lateritia]
MPISVLPTPPDFSLSKPPSKPTRGPVKTNYEPPNGSSAVDPTSSSSATESITVLKQEAKLSVQASAKGASAMALLRTARNQYLLATQCETQGDLKGALIAFTKAASLVQMIFGTAEWSQNGQNALKRELRDFMEKDSNVKSRLEAVEAKLTIPSEGNSVSQKSGGSIADRKKALQNSGLSISTSNKRCTSTSASFGSSPASASTSSISASNSSIYSHAFVSPSTFGPPSPGSSPSSSPTLPTRSFSTSSEYNAFNAQFSSIDELDESDGRLDNSTPFTLPSVPTGRSTNSNRSVGSARSGRSLRRTPHAALRNFMVPVVERPSSTPSTPFRGSGGIWDSRPGSPTPTSTSKAPPVNTCTPRELYNYLREHKIILLDVRERAEFEKGHIQPEKESKGVAWVCIEPAVLRRADVTSYSIEDSLALAPPSEASAFNNRHKFDLVVLYDRKSTSFTSNPDMSTLLRAIWEREFRKTLRRMPMMLVGGFEAWLKEFGISESGMSSDGPATRTTKVVNGSPNGVATNGANSSSVPPPPMSPSISPQGSRGRNPFAPGGPLASPAISAPATFSLQHTGSNGSRSRAGTSPSRPGAAGMGHKVNHSVDKTAISGSSHSRAPAESAPSNVSLTSFSSPSSMVIGATPLGASGPMSTLPEGALAPTILNGATPITYPSISTYSLPSASSSSITIRSPPPFEGMNGMNGIASPPLPPQASINPSVSRRRTSDYIDQTVNGISTIPQTTINYPELSSTHPILRPPPAAAAGTLERQDSIKRFPTPPSSSTTGTGSTIPSYPSAEWPPRYWADSPIGTSGLKNMGNTCYMNAPIQCLSATVPFARFFTEVDLKTAINYMNKMNSQGQLTRAFSRLVHDIWHGDMPYITPNDFRRTLCSLNVQYIGTSQHDSQEFLSFLLDGIHEDTNRIMARKPITRTPEEEERLENLHQQIAGEYEWQVWRQSNDSIIVDFFQGMFRNQLRCMKCEKTSTTYNAFSILSLPVPARSGKIPLQNCLKAFFNVEVMEGDDAWDCPRCKTKRPATKTLSLARLPPVLVIHLKRFEVNGRFSDKIDTFVDFPVKGLDLTDLMPPPLPVGADQSLLNGGMVNGVMSRDDPRIQVGPYKYELYGVTNHYGNLSSGHYTAFVASRGGWLYCDDSSVKNVDAKQVVNQKAYVLFYKRVKA